VQPDAFKANLLYPPSGRQSQTVRELGSDSVRDLGLGEIARQITREGIRYQQVLEIISSLPIDLEVIRYRQDVFEDIYRSSALFGGLEQIIPKINEIILFSDTRKDSRNPLQEAVWRLSELELYVECIDELFGAIRSSEEEIKSEGIRQLGKSLEAVSSSEQFQNLRRELPQLREGLRKKRSVTIGINLDERMRPVEATLLSVNEHTYHEKGLLPRLFGKQPDADFETTTTIHSSPVPTEYSSDPLLKVPLSPLFQDLEQLLGSTIRPLVRVLNRYMSMNTTALRTLQHDAAFFLGAVRFFRRLEQENLPVSKPSIRSMDDRHLEATDLFNPLLALLSGGSSDRIVLNGVGLDEESRLQILTGPNQGGKTTFTQAVGLVQVLAQCGMYVPAASASVSPVDLIVTHFPSEEKGQLASGRLGEEAMRFAALFDTVTENSMVLLNESLTSTSPAEGEYLAEDIIRALSMLGTRGLFATHLHGLAGRVESLNSQIGGRSRIGSLVAGVIESGDSSSATRTYRVRKGAPTGKSFARDIAEQYGISYEQIMRRLRERNLL